MPNFSGWDFLKTLHRSLYIQGTWNFERMLSLGYCFCLAPFAKKNLKSKEARADFLKRNLGFFNTHPYMASWIIGAAWKLEEAKQAERVEVQQIETFKRHLSTSLAVIGDQLFWKQLKPIAAMIGLLIALYFKVIGILVLLVLYNVPHFFTRIKGLLIGYKKGFDVIKDASIIKYRNIIDKLNVLAALIVGVLFVVVGAESENGSIVDVAAFIVGSILMYSFLKMSFSVPLSLIALSLLSFIAATFIYY